MLIDESFDIFLKVSTPLQRFAIYLFYRGLNTLNIYLSYHIPHIPPYKGYSLKLT